MDVITNNENGIIDRPLEIYECGNDKLLDFCKYVHVHLCIIIIRTSM